MKTIFKREFLGYYRTPVGYVFMGVFLALAGLIFYLSNLKSLSGDFLSFLSQMTLLNMLLCPLLTMRLICEERQKRTDQLLLTAPISLASAVLGKYFAAAAVLLLTILCSNLYTLIIAFYGTVYAGEWFVGYLGFTLQSLSFLALDLLVSCFAKNQITGAVAGFGGNWGVGGFWRKFFLVGDWLLGKKLSVSWLRDALSFISLYDRYEPFLLGQLSYASILFFVSFIVVCLAGAVRVLDARRFGEGGAA